MKEHPEGLNRAPTGVGFTDTQVVVPLTIPLPLLSRRNIESAQKNHRAEWDEAYHVLGSPITVEAQPKTEGRGSLLKRMYRFTDDERTRLATLAYGLFVDDRMVIEGERTVVESERTLDCDGCEERDCG
jgi:hypothetical protein